jgi:phosphoenolpyruvate carboxykinase (ATP)
MNRPSREHTELEEELHETAHIDYDRVAIVCHHPPSTLITTNRSQVANPSVSALYEDALVYETGSAMTSTGALTAYSGAKTGRSPLDKRIVKEEGSEKDVWWGPVNKPMSPDVSAEMPSSLSSHALERSRASNPNPKSPFRHVCVGRL